jgi:methylenetetrahydromethanopterin dehydrogenase
MEKVKIGILRTGNIGVAPFVDLILDERADREDIQVISIGSGAKLDPAQATSAINLLLSQNIDLVVYVTPNATLPGPKGVVSAIRDAGKYGIIISDAPAIKKKAEFEVEKIGYIFIRGDPMIGARREFLDPTEMVLFNSDIVKILAVTGVFKIIAEEIDKVIDTLKKGMDVQLPRIVISRKTIETLKFSNPYAKTKAMAAFQIAETVANVDVAGCFMIKERDRYIATVSAGHEMLRIAAKLADETRELEKANNGVIRYPHSKKGEILFKTGLFEKPRM